MAEDDLTKLRSTCQYKTSWFSVREDEVELGDGSKTIFYVVDCPASSFIVPVTDNGKIVLVKLFRYRTQRSGWELPAGSVEEGEDSLVAANRELQEETGYIAGSMHELTPAFDSMNGISDAVAHVYVATRLKESGHDEKEEEGITDVKAFSKNEIMEMVAAGEIVDGLSLAALLKYFATTEKPVKAERV